MVKYGISNKMSIFSSKSVFWDNKEYEGFYLSYSSNNDTTAVVLGNCERFKVLDGNHFDKCIEEYEKYGFLGLYQYFLDNIDSVSKYSE